MESYKILKVPVSKEKSVFYYYKKYEGKKENEDGEKQLVSLPADRTMQICHFVRPIDENTVQKFFGLVGKIKQIQIGDYKNKANNKRQRRTVYFALVVFKNAEDCRLALNDPKFLQGKVNKLMRKSVKFSSNPFAEEADPIESEDELTPEQIEKQQHQAKMQEGGFIMVMPEQAGAKTGRGTDGVSTVQGVSQEEALEYLKQKGNKLLDEEITDKVKYTSNKEKNAAINNDFYKFQIKDVKKKQLEDLRKGFEEDRRRLAKMLLKKQEKDKKASIKE